MNELVTELLKDLSCDDASSFINLDGLNKLEEFIYQSLFPLITKTDIYENPYMVCKTIEDAHSYWKSILLRPWIKDKTTIAFMGRFSAGKSSVINSILGERILPVDVTPTTAVPTYISFGPKLGIKAVDNDQNIKSIRQSVFSSLSKDSLGDFPIAKLIRHFVIEYKNESLLNKSILDTPGYDSLDAIDRHRALEVVQGSDAIIWVMDINDGDLSKDALELIKDKLVGKSISVIINKADKKSPAEREKVAVKVKDTLNKNNVKYDHCILYSSKDGGLKKNIQDILESVQGNSTLDYKQYIIDKIDDIIKNVNDFVVKYKKKLMNLEKMKNETEDEINKAKKKDGDLRGRPIEKIFPQIESAFFCDLKIPNKNAFSKQFEQILSEVRDNWKDIGIRESKIEHLEDEIEECEQEKQQKVALRKEAHKVKKKFKKIIDEVLS